MLAACKRLRPDSWRVAGPRCPGYGLGLRRAGDGSMRLVGALLLLCGGCAVALVAPPCAVGGAFSGGPAGHVSVFHPLSDERRPVLAVFSEPSRRPRVARLAPRGSADARVAVNRAGGAVAAWRQEEALWAAVRAPGGRRFEAPQRVGVTSGFALPYVAINQRGDAVVAWETDEESQTLADSVWRSSWRPAAGRFRTGRRLRVTPSYLALDDRGTALAVGSDEDLNVAASSLPRGRAWGKPRVVGVPTIGTEVDVVAASNGRGGVLAAWADAAVDELETPDRWRAAQRDPNGRWHAATTLLVSRDIHREAALALGDSGDAVLAYWDVGGFKAAVRSALAAGDARSGWRLGQGAPRRGILRQPAGCRRFKW